MLKLFKAIPLLFILAASAAPARDWQEATPTSGVPLYENGSTSPTLWTKARADQTMASATLGVVAWRWGDHAGRYSLLAHTHAGVYEPVIAAGTTAQYWRGDKSWQTLNQAAVAGLRATDSPVFTGVTAGNFSASGNTLSSTNANGDINITPNGTGAIRIGNRVARLTNTTENGSALIMQYSDAIPLLSIGTEGWQAYLALKQAGGGSETIRFRPSGSSYLTGGNTGLGTSTPQVRAHVVGDLSATGSIRTGGDGGTAGTIRIDASGNAALATATVGGCKDWGKLSAAPASPSEGDRY
jgi:hypothetical protein